VKFLSLFDGCHMFGLGARRAGFGCAGTSEIDTHAANVTRYHYPNTPQLGDVRDVGATDADLIIGGFPCQDLSVAGDRRGLAGERSGLFWEIVRIARESSPRWLLLENVPGLLSSNGGRDMGAVLGALGELGYGWAYRVFDAQHFGVPQRRRRVFIVGCFGDARRAGEVLFEPESVRGNPTPRRQEAGAIPPLALHHTQHPITGRVSHCIGTESTVSVATRDGVRRLMPVECERLQGLPDDWTRYGRREDGEVYELADGPRYKMIGNGGYVGAVEWIARRIIDTGRRSHTLNTTAERATRET
jgi:DNA (cytosine-5)-methyltransferase 1